MPEVMIHPAAYDDVRPAIDRAVELFPVKLRGKKVLIKPNVLRVSPLSKPADSHFPV
jgi:uncharacterized protein (DUF362 family)